MDFEWTEWLWNMRDIALTHASIALVYLIKELAAKQNIRVWAQNNFFFWSKVNETVP